MAGLADDVRRAVQKGEFDRAERLVQSFETNQRPDPELAAAVSWLGRAALAARNLDLAETYASRTRELALRMLPGRKLDDDTLLPIALGASIEVHAQVLNARGDKSGAVWFLRAELETYASTSLRERIQKNINLLSLEGKVAPALAAEAWLGPAPPTFGDLRGRPAILFFWAHWCPDCKAEAPILSNVMKIYGPKGLFLIGPTKLYGYTTRGEDATPEAEKHYIEQVRRQYYAALGDFSAPIDARNFDQYGASTTPTLVLVDAAGIVRLYHPGNLTEKELSSQIEALLMNP